MTETAGVRGIDESDLKSAALDQTQLDAMVGNRVEPPVAATFAQEHGWQALDEGVKSEDVTWWLRKFTAALAEAPTWSGGVAEPRLAISTPAVAG